MDADDARELLGPRRELEAELLTRWRDALGAGDHTEVARLVNASHTIRDGAIASQRRGATLGWAEAERAPSIDGLA